MRPAAHRAAQSARPFSVIGMEPSPADSRRRRARPVVARAGDRPRCGIAKPRQGSSPAASFALQQREPGRRLRSALAEVVFEAISLSTEHRAGIGLRGGPEGGAPRSPGPKASRKGSRKPSLPCDGRGARSTTSERRPPATAGGRREVVRGGRRQRGAGARRAPAGTDCATRGVAVHARPFRPRSRRARRRRVDRPRDRIPLSSRYSAEIRLHSRRSALPGRLGLESRRSRARVPNRSPRAGRGREGRRREGGVCLIGRRIGRLFGAAFSSAR
jgi:hypothetical protein